MNIRKNINVFIYKITFFCFYFCFNTKSIFPSTDNPIFTSSNSLNGIKKAFAITHGTEKGERI